MPDRLLPPALKEELERSWRTRCNPPMSFDQGMKLRHKAQSDLYFLARELLGCDKLKDPAHREICDFFVKKDPDAGTFEEFARDYDGSCTDVWGRICTGVHDRAISLMRHGFKSTMNICDKVQWTICYPEIRINLMTDVLGLSQEFVGTFKGHFTLQSNGDPKIMPDGRPSLFQILFPEFCDTRPADYTSTDSPQWTTPARYGRFSSVTAPTIRAASAKAGKTGTHCDLAVFDDVVTENSVGSEGSVATNLAKIARRISMARNLRAKYGFTDFIFTPYMAADYNSQIVDMEAKRAQMGLVPLIAVMLRPAGKLSELARAQGKTWNRMLELEDFDVEMWDPEECTLEDLKREWSLPNGRDMVASQKLLDVTLKQRVKITREELIAATRPFNEAPADGITVMAGDLAYSTKPKACWTVLITARLSQARYFITSIKRDKIDPRIMPLWLATNIFAQRPDRIVIEDMPGAQWMHTGLEYEFGKMDYNGARIEWREIGQGQWKVIENEAELTFRLINQGRLQFSTGIEQLDAVYDEVTAFPSATQFDDIVSAMNRMVHHFTTEAELMIGEAEDRTRTQRESLWDQRIHGYGPGASDMQADRALANLVTEELPD